MTGDPSSTGGDPNETAADPTDDERQIAAYLEQEKPILDKITSIWDRYPDSDEAPRTWEQDEALEEEQAPLLRRLRELRDARHEIENRIWAAQKAAREANQQPQAGAKEERVAPEPPKANQQPIVTVVEVTEDDDGFLPDGAFYAKGRWWLLPEDYGGESPDTAGDDDDEKAPRPLEDHEGEVQIITPAEPNKTRPIWVLFDRGGVRGRRGARQVVMQEWVWAPLSQTYRKTGTPDQYVSLYKALAAADWIGRLPHQARRRRVATDENLDRIAALVAEDKTDAQIANILTRRGYEISKTSVRNLRKTYLD